MNIWRNLLLIIVDRDVGIKHVQHFEEIDFSSIQHNYL